MDGASVVSLLHLHRPAASRRAITVVILIETIFLLSVFAEILVTTGGGPGYDAPTSPILVYARRCSSTTSAALRPAASWRWCSPTSSRSSWCASIGKNLEA